MSIISNGTIDITLTDASERDNFPIEKSTVRSAGGRLKSQTIRGRRFSVKCEARVTAATFDSLLDLLTDQSSAYYFTPKNTAKALYAPFTFPIEASITLNDVYFDNGSVYYISLDVEGVDPY